MCKSHRYGCFLCDLTLRLRATFPFGNLAFSLSLTGSLDRGGTEHCLCIYVNNGMSDLVTGY